MSNKLVRNENCIVRDESSMKRVPDGVIRVMPFIFLLDVVSLILLILSVRGTIGLLMPSIVLVVFGFGFGFFADNYWNWNYNCKYSFEEGKLIYSYDLSTSILNKTNCSVVIEISELTKIKVRKKKAILKGKIYETRPNLARRLRKGNVEVWIDFAERNIIIKEFENLKVRR